MRPRANQRAGRFLLWATLASAAACGGPDEVLPGHGPPFAVVSGPEVELDPNGTTPLAARLSLETNQPSTVEVAITGGAQAWTHAFDEEATSHELPLLGFRPDADYSIEVTVTEVATGKQLAIDDPLSITTDPLPDAFPTIDIDTAEPDRMEPGLTLFDVAGSTGYLVILDAGGHVVWYHHRSGSFGDARQLENGDLLFTYGDIIEMDMLGDEVRRYHSSAGGDAEGGAIVVEDPAHGFHHEVFPTPDDTLLSLGLQVTTQDLFHVSYDDPSARDTVDVTDDVVLEIARDGSVLRRWPLLDLLDPQRIGYDSLSDHFAEGTPNDWAHANGVILDPRDGAAIVSSRHQDALFKFSLETGEVKWILANHDNWSAGFQDLLLDPTGTPFEWQYHQHAPAVTPDGTVIMFDNGNRRASPWDGTTPIPDAENYSRAVEYRIDEDAMTVEQVWEYGSAVQPQLYSFFIGDADYMPQTGNILITYGGLKRIGDQTNADLGRGTYQARLVEVERGASDQVVFQASIYGDAADAPAGWRVYRSDRIPGLYR